jgi:hypothetical protein
MTNAPGVATSRQYQLENRDQPFASLIPVAYVPVDIDDPGAISRECDSLAELMEAVMATSALYQILEDEYGSLEEVAANAEWIGSDDTLYSVYSGNTSLMQEFAETFAGETAGEFPTIWADSVLQEVERRPRQYANVNVEAVIEQLEDQYELKPCPTNGAVWVRKAQVEAQAPRASSAQGFAVLEEVDGHDGSDY